MGKIKNIVFSEIRQRSMCIYRYGMCTLHIDYNMVLECLDMQKMLEEQKGHFG